MDDEECKTPTKQKMPPLQLEEEEDTWESWEDTDPDAIQLATTPVKEVTLKSPGSPGPLKVYDIPYLLQFKAQPPNARVKAFFPPPEPPRKEREKEKEKEKDEHREEKREREKKPRRSDNRSGFGQDNAQRDRPFANLMITSDQRPIVVDPDAAPPTNPFFQPSQVGVRPLFGTQLGGKGGQTGSMPSKQQRALSKLERRVANPFKVRRPENEMQATVKRVQGVLNKITPEKYQELFEQMWEDLNEFNLYDVDDDDAMNVLDQVIGMIFEKALSEPNYSQMYADVARDLCDMAIQVSQETGNSDAKPLEHFRKMLLDRCQTEFETRLVNLPNDPQEREQIVIRHRKRSVGNIKFIAELFKRNMLTEKIMHDVIKSLLLGPPPHSEQHMPTCEELEVLCKLWSVAGKILDRPKAVEYINYYFAIMARHSQTYHDIRLRFMLADIIDLRSNEWVPRREQDSAKKISESGEGGNRFSPRQAAERSRLARDGKPAAKGRARSPLTAKPDVRILQNNQPTTPSGSPIVTSYSDSALDAANTHGKGRGGSGRGQKGKDQRGRGKGQAPIPAAPIQPKELSSEEMDGKVVWLVAEFAETQNTMEMLECLSDLGAVNHPLFVARAVYRVIENHKLSDERVVLACLLNAFVRSTEEQSVAKQRAAALHKGFQMAVCDVFEYEAWVDSPYLWHDLCEFLLELIMKGVIQFDFLNTIIHPDSYAQYPEAMQDFIAELFTQLKSKELEWVTCTAFYQVLSLFLPEHLPRLLQTLTEKGVLESDITIYAYNAASSNQPLTDCIPVLESRMDADLLKGYQPVVCAKVANGVLSHITAAVSSCISQQCEESSIMSFERTSVAALKPLLERLLTSGDTENEIRSQVAVLNELQRICAQYHFPKGHIARMFELLYEEKLCQMSAFNAWIEGTTDIPDKGKAIFEVNSFLQSLKTRPSQRDREGQAANGTD